MSLQTLSLSAIYVDPTVQQREELDQEVVFEYAEAYLRGDKVPPPVVFFDGMRAILAGGFHRYHARVEAQYPSMECDVRDGTRRDALWFALTDNRAHGLRRTGADKRKAVATLLADPEWAQLSDRKIADELGVSHTMVAYMRSPEKEIQAAAQRKAGNEARKVATVATQNGASPAPAPVQTTVATPIPAPAPGPVITLQAAVPNLPSAADQALASPPAPADTLDPITTPAALNATTQPTVAPPADPTPEELVASDSEHTLRELDRLQAIVDNDEPLKAALETIKRQDAHIAGLEARINGLTNECGMQIRTINSLKRKLKLYEREAA